MGGLASIPCVAQASPVTLDDSPRLCLHCWLTAGKEWFGWDFGFLKVHLPQPKDAFASMAYFVWEGDASCVTQSILFLTQNMSCQLDEASRT